MGLRLNPSSSSRRRIDSFNDYSSTTSSETCRRRLWRTFLFQDSLVGSLLDGYKNHDLNDYVRSNQECPTCFQSRRRQGQSRSRLHRHPSRLFHRNGQNHGIAASASTCTGRPCELCHETSASDLRCQTCSCCFNIHRLPSQAEVV